jgi:hypothetical protein
VLVAAPVQPAKPMKAGPLPSEVMRKYIAEKTRAGNWREKTLGEIEATFKLLLEMVGDVPFAAVGYDELRGFKDALLRLPANMNKSPRYRGKLVQEILAMRKGTQIRITRRR